MAASAPLTMLGDSHLSTVAAKIAGAVRLRGNFDHSTLELTGTSVPANPQQLIALSSLTVSGSVKDSNILPRLQQ